MADTYQFLDVKQSGDISTVRLVANAGEVEVVAGMSAELNRLVDSGCRKLIVDLVDVEFLQSEGLGVFVGLDKKISGVKGKLCLCNLQSHVAEMFEITGLDDVIEIQDDESAALGTFES